MSLASTHSLIFANLKKTKKKKTKIDSYNIRSSHYEPSHLMQEILHRYIRVFKKKGIHESTQQKYFDFFSNEFYFLLFTVGTEEGYKKVWDIHAKKVERVEAGKDYLHQKELVSNKVQNHVQSKIEHNQTDHLFFFLM